MKETRSFLICGIALLIVACGGGGGGGGGGANIEADSTGQVSGGAVGAAYQPATETPATETPATANGTSSSQSNVSWLLNKSATRLNKSPSTANSALNALPGNYYNARNALRAEVARSSPNAALYLNYGSIFGKNEGQERSPAEDHLPGTWILGASCYYAGVGSCWLESEVEDAHHIVDADGTISPYFVGWYDRNGNSLRGDQCNETNLDSCEVKITSSVAVGMPNWNSTSVQPIMTANGINMVQTSGTRADRVSGAPFDFVGYGAWMDYSGFFAEGYLYNTGDGRKQENTAWTFGIVTGMPSVASGQTMTWNGTMAGMKGSQAERQLGDPYVERDFEAVQGDAVVTAHNDGGLQIMVALTDIFYLNPAKSGSIPDLVWDRSQLSYDALYPGRFTSNKYNNNEIVDLSAAFYGPNQEEVAGTFDWESGDDFIVGAFGAKRVTQ